MSPLGNSLGGEVAGPREGLDPLGFPSLESPQQPSNLTPFSPPIITVHKHVYPRGILTEGIERASKEEEKEKSDSDF